MNKLLIVVFLLVTACSNRVVSTEEKRSIAIVECQGDDPGFARLRSVNALCGKYSVFENRKTQKGRKIDLNIAVLPAFANRPEPDPLFFLAGGPGQAATDLGPLISRLFKKVLAHRDIVFVDQRGTGLSNPLDCEWNKEGDLAKMLRVEPPLKEIEACVNGYDADLGLYTTDIAMDDLDEVREKLGYDKINIYGGSYGTRAALMFLRRHGDKVRSVILDGVAPFQNPIPVNFADDAEKSLELLLEDCKKSRHCDSAFPNIKQKLDDLLEQLEQNPGQVSLKHPRTGKLSKVEIKRDNVTGILFSSLYSSEVSALIPLAIEKAI